MPLFIVNFDEEDPLFVLAKNWQDARDKSCRAANRLEDEPENITRLADDNQLVIGDYVVEREEV